MTKRRGSKEVVAIYRCQNLADLIIESTKISADFGTRPEETLTDGCTVYNLEIRPETAEETRRENE